MGQAPEVGTVEGGYRFKGGDPASESSWEQVAPIAAPEYGPGAQRLPNGSVVRYGPRGGMDTIVSASAAQQAAAGEDGVPKLTEGQGKAMLYGGMMAGAERDYQAARANGYDPTSFRNQAANVAGLVPFDGDFFGRFIRDTPSDAGRQAELRWAEGNLRQLTGAAATNPEIARVAAINFDRGNDQLGAQRYRTRAETYQGTRYAAGDGAASLPAYPGAPADIAPLYQAPDNANDLPSYPSIEARTAGMGDAPMPSGGFGGGSPDGPQPGDVETTVQPLAPEDTPNSLSAQGYVYDAGSDTWKRSRQVEVNPDEARRAGEVQRSRPDGNADMGVGRRADAFMRGAADTLSFGFADEIAAGLNTVIPADRGSRSGWQDGFGQAYQNNINQQRGIDAADARDLPVTRGAGQIGAGLIAVPKAAASVAPRAAGWAGNALRAAGGGAAYGGAYGFGSGEGNALDRAPGAAVGVGIGAVAGATAPTLGRLANRYVAAPVGNALQGGARFLGRQVGRAGVERGVPGAAQLLERATPDPLQAGMRRFADRSPQQAGAMTGNVERFRAEGIDPTFADTVNDGGRGTMRALATRQTPARQGAREFAANRAEGLQDRVAGQARRHISADTRPPEQIRSQITTRRNAQADQSFGAVRGDMVTADRSVMEALRTPAMRPAIEEAATSALNRGDNETAAMLRNLTDDALDYGPDTQMTVGMADRLARALNGRGEAAKRAGNNDAAGSLFNLAERLRGPARSQVKGYDEALTAYAGDSRLAEATTLGESFMNMEADQFAAAVNRLSPEERQVARAAARRAVERSAGTQGQAPGVAQRLSGGREQAQRSEALLGDPSGMQRGMRTELEALRNAQAVNPAQGSPTSMNAQDAGNAAGQVLGAARDVATGNVPGLAARALAGIRSRGFSDQQAEAIIEAAIDPDQTDRLVSMLSERMNRREARNLARAIRYQLTIGPQSGQQR